MAELRWGILSTAAIGRRKVVPAIQRARRCRVVAVGSRDVAKARAYATALDIPTVHDSYAAVLADAQVDAVYIPLPNHLHAEWAIAAARAGKHVLCEKPLALNAAQAERIVAACESAGVVLLEAFMYRFHPSWIAVHDMIAAGRIGRLVGVQTWFGYFNDDRADIRNIVEFGGGALYDVGCYGVSLSRLLFDAEPREIEAVMVRDPQSGTDVLTSAVLGFDGGVASFSCTTRGEPDQRVHIYGTQGRISIGIPFNIPIDRPAQIFVTAGGEPPISPRTEVLEFGPADQYTLQAEAFAAAVLDGAPLSVSPTDGVANMRVIDEIFAVARQV